ncbi:DNA cytosine methyltransferase [Nocardiopsis sp. CT-R113]|uniref:DNA (cytosine-5-)-methyltransferase n=1 Tax=Nocardiopsis codii TaxID=3065942 RepID=A0ABU7KCY4_9ACTN|nr:DNA cytosine methyltransferase [Nocardiopsis sp. CT-R113]MEE2040089.1 DNA cytosine methyltransferase [Nocardiopsis sp. CT-R113]
MADYFCGAGGSSTGAIQVPGVTIEMAANHWPMAVDTHNRNHPHTRHDCADLSQVDPRRHPTTDIGWFSPECTKQTRAQGVKRSARQQFDLFTSNDEMDSAERSRATMWDVIRFAEFHQYRYVIVENVIDIRGWALWPAWAMSLSCLEYEFRFISLNSMFASALGDPAAQSRNRGYIVAWRRGETAPDFDAWLRPFADCPTHGRVQAVKSWKNGKTYGEYGPQYIWRCPRVECRNTQVHPRVRPAVDIIDWTVPALRIGDRTTPLVPNTMRRIRSGVAAYGRPVEDGTHVKPWITELRGGGSKHRPMAHPLSTVTAGGNHHAVTIPDLIYPYYGKSALRPAGRPLPTVTTVDTCALLEGGTIRDVDDLRYRMLKPHEYAAAQQFPADYQWPKTKSEYLVRMAGNAVSTNAARDLVGMVAAQMDPSIVPTWSLGAAA